MRSVAAFLAFLLCLYWTRAQSESRGETGNDITHTEVQSEIQDVKTTTEIWAELRELRHIVIEHTVELRNSKSKIEKLEQENAAIQARLTASESKNEVLEARMNASENVVKELQRETIVLEARLSASDNMVEELKRESTVLEARMSASENEVEELKRENTDLLARVTACENKNTELEARMSSNENEVVELKRENADRPKVAFSLGLTDAGRVGPFNTDITLKFSRVYTNYGQAYSPTTGIFTAPVRGAYYFRFTAFNVRGNTWSAVQLYHNGKRVVWNSDYNDEHGHTYMTNALVLQLEKGDVVYMVLPANYGVFDDDSSNYTTFSGFLLFPL